MIGSAAPAPGEEPILLDLAEGGFRVGSLANLRWSGVRYRAVIPVLFDWLGRASDPKVTGPLPGPCRSAVPSSTIVSSRCAA